MLHRIANFFRQLSNSKGFQRGLRIFFGVFAVYYVYSVIIYLLAVMNTGVSLGEALRFYFGLSFLPPSVSVAFGIVIGLVWYFNMKKNKQDNVEPDNKTEESSDAEQEEETNELTHYKYL